MELFNKKIFDSDKIFDVIIVILMCVFTIIIILPIWNIVVNSFSSSSAIAEGKSVFWPKGFTFDNYKAVFNDSSITRAFFISVSKTVVGVIGHVFLFNDGIWIEQEIFKRKKVIYCYGDNNHVFWRRNNSFLSAYKTIGTFKLILGIYNSSTAKLL